MIIHLHPPTCSSPLDLVLEGCRFEPFFGSIPSALLYIVSSSFAFFSLSHVVGDMRRRGERDSRENVLPSSALIENDLTDIWITVGFWDVVEIGRLFATPSATHIHMSTFRGGCSRIRLLRVEMRGNEKRKTTYMTEWYHPVISVPHVIFSNTTEKAVDSVLSNLTMLVS